MRRLAIGIIGIIGIVVSVSSFRHATRKPYHFEGDAEPTYTPLQPQLCPSNPVPQDGCEIISGDAQILLTGDVVAGGRVLKNGRVLIGADGRVAAVGCDVPIPSTSTQLRCGNRWILPGMLNLHEHLVYDRAQIKVAATYVHRNEWRKGLNSKPEYDPPPLGGNALIRVELRDLLHGVTTVAAAESDEGLIRNLATFKGPDGRVAATVTTFPLGDQHQPGFGAEDCDYPEQPAPEDISTRSYIAHLDEGTTAAARQELRCLWKFGWEHDPRLAVVHGIELEDADVTSLARSHQSVIWSPRSNLALYGQTAPIDKLVKANVKVALGTDWSSTGSSDIQAEARCALDYAAANDQIQVTYDRLLSMVTTTAARAVNLGGILGDIAAGSWGDLLVVEERGGPSESVLGGGAERIDGVFISGKAVLMPAAWRVPHASRCETLPGVCGAAKVVCGVPEDVSLASLLTPDSRRVRLWRCGEPPSDPVCATRRPSDSITAAPGQAR